MQDDSMNVSSSGHMTQNQVVTQESPNKSFQCSHCLLPFKSKVYLFEHLSSVHGLDVDAALREAGLKYSGTNKANTDDKSEDDRECQHCDFKASGWEVLMQHNKQCHEKSEDPNVMGKLMISENPETNVTAISTNASSDAAGGEEISVFSVLPTSNSTFPLSSSKDLKTYKRPLQTITKYFAASSESNEKPPVIAESPKLLESSKGTIILQESPSTSSPNSSGVFKVTAKSRINITDVSQHFLLTDQFLNTDLKPPKPKEQSRETVPSKEFGRRISNEGSKGPPAKKAKSDQEETEPPEERNAMEQQSSINTEFSFDVSEDEEEKKLFLVNGDTEDSKIYFCKHCNHSDGDINHVSAHYQNNHPYVRHNAAYIQDPSDESATFRCLQCPVEFVSVADLKKHYSENHPEAPNVFTMKSSELSLVFKCFMCSFTTNTLKALKDHNKENHPTHKVDNNSLMFCRYYDGCQEGSCETAQGPERHGGISPERTLCKEVNDAVLCQQPSPAVRNVVFYHCSNCKFSHKSAVVMHVHYQKSHPHEEITINKIKQSACVTLQTPENSPNSVTIKEKSAPQTSISGPSEKTKDKAELAPSKRIPEASNDESECPKMEKESMEDTSKDKMSLTKCKRETQMDSSSKLFYCQFCSYSSTSVKSVVGHHNAKHAVEAPTCIEDILCFSAAVQKKEPQSEGHQEEEEDAADALVTGLNPYACAEDLFYCQKCNFANPSVKGVANHQTRIHKHLHYSRERILYHTALVRDEIEKSKSQAKEFSFSTRLPLPLMNEGDEDKFFCHFCNYRQSTVDKVVRHYVKKHHGFVVKAERISLYSSMVRAKTQKLHLKPSENQVDHVSQGEKGNKKEKTKELGTSSSDSPPSIMAVSQTQRILQCYRCPYTTQYLNDLRGHIWQSHKANRSIRDVLRVCFKQGNIQTGYHCYLCVFSHENAAIVYDHYQEQHPECPPSLEYVISRLFVGPDTRPAKRKKHPKTHTRGVSDSDGTDSSLPSQRYGQNETKLYSCRACSFKGRSVSVIARHYRAVHPWSVKEDGSVPVVINSKRASANRQVEDHNNMPGSFEAFQMPLEFDKLPESAAYSTPFSCPHCPAAFHNQHGLSVHCGMKHHDIVNESEEPQPLEQLQEQPQDQTRVHVFKCPHCTYVNTSYHGVLTHCQMKHPALPAKADSFHMDEAHLPYWSECVKTKGPGSPGKFKLSGYMCESCPRLCSRQEKLDKHCEKDHTGTAENTAPNAPKPSLKPSTLSKIKQYKMLRLGRSEYTGKKAYAVIRCQYCSYICSTKIALDRHCRFHHKKIQDGVYKCVLCSRSYFTKKRLGSHYIKKHGRDSFSKYYAPIYKQAPEKPAPTSEDHRLVQEPENTQEAKEEFTLSTTTEENKTVLIYRCPSCPYVNASYHGTLTHCQMKHPDVVARADELKTDDILVINMIGCTIGKGSNERGYMCKICPLVYPSLKKLKIHCERDHVQTVSTIKQSDHKTESFKKKHEKTSATSATIIDLHHQLATPEARESNTLYKCHICTYTGFFRRYLQVHYKKTHKLDPLTTTKLLQKYDKRKRARRLPEAESGAEESTPIKCIKCPEMEFHSFQLLVAHYSDVHSSEGILDFTVLSQGSKKGSTGLYRCVHCNKQMNGIRKLWYHLDCHRERKRMKEEVVKTTASPEDKSTEPCQQDELPTFDTVNDLARWSVKPLKTLSLPRSPLIPPSEPTDTEQPQVEPREETNTCKQCWRTFMSLKGLRSHERSHAAMAALKKLNSLPPTVSNHNINKYVMYKAGTTRPFLCGICSYRTTVMGLWRSHFMKTHHDVITDDAETDDQEEESVQRADGEPLNLSEEVNYWPEVDEESEITEKSLYSEPPDVQRQLNHYSLMAQADAQTKTNKLPENILLNCEYCSFNTGHLSSIRRHYLNRHGKKILKCKDCDFVTGKRKTLEKHIEMGHSTCQSDSTDQKDFRCPFCLYQTKNKNNMIDHIVLHREERVVPIEVRRSKLSRYLRGIVFRCHKCTFTSGSADNLRSHMTKHDDVRPYKCRLCYFDCIRLNELEAHLSDKHQVARNHELVGQVSLSQLQARYGRIPEEEEQQSSNLEHHNDDSEDVETEDTDCNDTPHVPHEITLQTQKAYQEQRRDSKDEDGPAKSSESDIQCRNMGINPNAAVQEKHPQEQAGSVFLPAQHKVGDGDGLSGALQHRATDMEVRVQDDVLRRIPPLDEDGNTRTHKKAEQDTTVYTNNTDAEALDDRREMILLDEKALNRKNQVNMEALSSLVKKNQPQANNCGAQESFTVGRQFLTLSPKCAELQVSRHESLGVSVINCKKGQVCNPINREEVREPYGEMPVLENEYLKEEMQPISCCKEEDQSDEDEMITEDNENDQDHDHEGDRTKEVGSPHVAKGALTVKEGAAVPCPATTGEKLFTCELCGRNLMNHPDLERHIMRHGI